MKKVSIGRLIFVGLLVIFTLVMVLTSFSYFPKARLVPLVVGIPTLILAILAIIGEAYPKLLRSLDVNLKNFNGWDQDQEARLEELREMQFGRRVLIQFIWLIGFIILIYLVGFLIGIAVFAILFLKVYGKVGWIKTLAIAAGTWGFIFFMFETFMKVALFKGVLFGAIVPPI